MRFLKHNLLGALLMLCSASFSAQVNKVELPLGQYAFTFQEDLNGIVWIGLSDGNASGALGYVENKRFHLVSGTDKLPNGSFHCSLQLPDGSLLFGGNVVDSSKKSLLVWVSPAGADTLQIPFFLSNPFINSITLVNRHEIWISTASGLLINKRGQWSRVTTNNGLPNNIINTIYQDFRGIIWIGTEHGVAFSMEDKIHKVEPGSNIINSATLLFGDSRGYVWCGSRFSSEGISVYNGQIWETFSGRHGLVDNSASIFYQDPNGILWVGSCYNRSRGGVSALSGNKWVGYSSSEHLAKPCVDAIISDSKGRIWFGGSLTPRRSKGITVLDGDAWKVIANNNLLPAERVISFFLDSKDQLWISSLEGLFILSPEFNP